MKKSQSTCIGIDEAGRGPWAGPVVAACVVLPKNFNTSVLRDSKQLSSRQRDLLYKLIVHICDYGTGIISANIIDNIGIKKATEKAMNEAIKKCIAYHGHKYIKRKTKLLVDGNDKFSFPYSHISIIKGDEKIPAISAASIVAKVTRDRIMRKFHAQYPQYGFDRHKGYGTKMHLTMLKEYGICPIHRLTYKPVQAIYNNT